MAKFNPYVLNFSDLGEVYQKEQDRILKREEEAMAWYDQIVEERGPFTEGTREQLNNLFGQIDEELTLGNATPQGRAKIKKLYNEYRDVAANALNYSQDIDKALIEVRTNPGSYSDPEIRVQELEEMRFAPVDLRTLASKKVDLSPYRLYDAPPIMAPIDQAKYLIDTIGGQFYEKGMKLGDTDIKNLITDELLLSANNPENIAKMIAYKYGEDSLRTLGGKQRLERLVRQEDESSKKEFVSLLTDYAIEVGDSLNLILTEQDKISTEREASNQAYRDKLYIKQTVEGDGEPELYFISNVNTSSFKINDEGEIERGELRSYPFAVDLKKPFKQTYKNKELDIDRIVFDGLGNLGFIVSETIINPLDDEEFVSTTFVPQENIPGALARVQKTNPGIGKTLNNIRLENAEFFQKNKENSLDDSSGGVAKVFKNNEDINVDELADAYNKREEDKENHGENLDKNFGNKQPRRVRKNYFASQNIFNNLSEEQRLIVKTRAEEMKKNDLDKKASSVTKKFKSDQSKKTKRIDTALNEIRILGNQDVIDEANLLLGEFIKTKTESITSQDISNDKKITLYEDLAKDIESKLKTLDRYNNNVDLKPLSLDQVKSFIEDLSKKKYQEGGKVSEQSPLGRIFNRFRKALTQS